jgi:RHS repeat-associated protein
MRTLRLLVARAGLMLLAAAAASAAQAQAPFTSYARYDAAHRLTGTVAPDPDGSGPLGYAAVRNSYDAAGRLVRQERGEIAQTDTAWMDGRAPSAWTNFTVLETVDTVYDTLDRKVSETLSGGGTVQTLTQYSYDPVGRLECTAVRMNPAAFGALPASACTQGTPGSQGPDRIARTLYDPAGEVLKVQKAYGTPLQQDYVTYEYTPDGKQQAVTDANGNRAEMTYDGFDRQARWVFPSKATPGSANPADYEEYGYDPAGNRTSLRKRDGTVLTYAYDALNRVTVKTVPASATGAAGYSVYTGYDNRNLELYARFGSAAGAGIANDYDNAGRLASSTTTMDGIYRTLASQYDADGNRTGLNGNDGYHAGWDYDAAERATYVRNGAGTPIVELGYTPRGERAFRRVLPSLGSSASYGYDDAGRLSSLGLDLARTSADQSYSFAYNPASQIVARTGSNDAYASTTAYNVSRSYSVNGLNQYTTAGTATFAYDANGNLTSDGTDSYVYDAENRLVSRSGGVTLSYDPDGRLWQVSAPSGTTRFLYDGDRLVEEMSGTGQPQRGYIHGPGTDEPLLWSQFVGTVANNYLHADHQGSIVAIADEAGNPVAINGYDAWGIPNAANLGRFGYTGQAWLPELGMWYYKARIYSPTHGRFLQTIRLGIMAGSIFTSMPKTIR